MEGNDKNVDKDKQCGKGQPPGQRQPSVTTPESNLPTLTLSRNSLNSDNDRKFTKGSTWFYSTEKVDEGKRGIAKNDLANCRVLKLPGLPDTPYACNLLEGQKDLPNVWKDEKIDILLKSLIRHKLVGKSRFVCKAKLLVLVAMTAFDVESEQKHNVPTIYVEKIDDTHYMYLEPKDLDVSEPNLAECEYMGLKFEQHVTSEPGKEPTPSADVGEKLYNEFGVLVEWKLDEHEIIISGEIDCCDKICDESCDQSCDQSNHLVEIKTTQKKSEEPSYMKRFDKNLSWRTKQEETQKKSEMTYTERFDQNLSYRKKLQWWIRCHLLGVKTLVWGERIVLGERNEKGLSSISSIPVWSPGDDSRTDKLHDQTNKVDIKSKSETCRKALHRFLEFVREEVEKKKESSKRQVYKISRECGKDKFTIEKAEFIGDELYGDLKSNRDCRTPEHTAFSATT